MAKGDLSGAGLTNHSFPVKNCSVGSTWESTLQPTCSAPCLLQHCWWGTTHSCHSECLWRNEKIYDLVPYSPSTSVFLPRPPAFPELEGQKFKSCFEQLLTCYQLLHIASAGVLTISLEMSLLRWLLHISIYKNILRWASFELSFLYWYIGLAKLFLSSPATDEKWLLLILFNDWIH